MARIYNYGTTLCDTNYNDGILTMEEIKDISDKISESVLKEISKQFKMIERKKKK